MSGGLWFDPEAVDTLSTASGLTSSTNGSVSAALSQARHADMAVVRITNYAA